MFSGRGRDGTLLGLQRLMLPLLILIASLLLFPEVESNSEYEMFTEGEVAPRQVLAPFDLEVPKPEAEYQAETRRAREEVPAYFRRDDAVLPRVLERYDEFVTNLNDVLASAGPDTFQVLMDIQQLGVDFSDGAQRVFIRGDGVEQITTTARDFLSEVLTAGLTDKEASERVTATMHHMLLDGQTYIPVGLRELVYTQEKVNRHAGDVSRVNFGGQPVKSEAFRALITAHLEPNVHFDRAWTEQIQNDAASRVTKVERRYLQNEVIVDASRVVTAEAVRALDALRAELDARQDRRVGWQETVAVAGRGLITAALLMFAVLYLRLHRRRVFARTSKLVLLSVTCLVVLAMSSLTLNALNLPWLVIPMAAGSMVVSLLIDAQLGVFFTSITVVLVALNAGLGIDFVAAAFLSGFTAVYAVRRVRHRSEIFRALLLVTMVNIFCASAVGMMHGDLGFSMLTNTGWAVVSALLSTAVALFMIPILEMTCRVTTDLTLLELSDLNRPLLKRLMLEAPGTYHHSMVMGTLVDAGCEAVGANSLLGRVQCYYHDIGKMNKPEYFIENIALNPRAKNPHDRLTPSMSSLILESHVREGVSLAREHKLPEPIIEGIREHHGTSVMSFFYEKARAQDESTKLDEYRYPGPKPQSKETAIVMLADGVEAASRVLTDPRPARIKSLVTHVIEDRVEARELEQCGLTLADLARIREAFVHVLTGMFHGRVRYPADADAATAAERSSQTAIGGERSARNGSPERPGKGAVRTDRSKERASGGSSV